MAPVTIKQLRFGYFPKVFVVDGVEHTVQAVDKCWTVEQKQLWFRVVCETGMIELYRDAKQNTWHLAGAQ